MPPLVWLRYRSGARAKIRFSDGRALAVELTIPAGGATMLVRTAITQDSTYEGAETFKLVATNTGGTPAEGTGTIKDDGTGDIFKYSGNTSPTPLPATDPSYPVLDDDRPLSVNSITVNEASPFATFTVSAASGQLVKLALANGTAQMASSGTPLTDGTMDYGPALEYWSGSAWTWAFASARRP